MKCGQMVRLNSVSYNGFRWSVIVKLFCASSMGEYQWTVMSAVPHYAIITTTIIIIPMTLGYTFTARHYGRHCHDSNLDSHTRTIANAI